MVQRKSVSLFLMAMSVVAGAQRSAPLKNYIRRSIPSKMNGIVPGELLVKLNGLSTQDDPLGRPRAAQVSRISEELGGATFGGGLGRAGWTRWEVSPLANPQSLVKALQKDRDVIYVEPEYYVYPVQLSVPNDGDWSAIESRSTFVFSFGSSSTGGLSISSLPQGGGGGTGSADFRRLWNIWDTNAVTSDANGHVSGGWAVYPGQWFTAATKPKTCPIIAFIDTGLDLSHPDFINAGGTGTDVNSGGQILTSLSGYFQNGVLQPGVTPTDQNGHGTHVAGIALASGNNGSMKGTNHGMIGIGYNSQGMILRVFDSAGNATDSNAAGAIYYAVDHGADIINLSLGDTNYSQVFQDAVTYAWQKGALVVCAGNENGAGGGNLGPIYPAACSGALGVTANAPGLYPADDYYAGYGNYVGVAAPGGDLVQHSISSYSIQYVWSTATTYSSQLSQDASAFPPYTLDYTYLVGTSMASPHVAGAAGLFYGKNSYHQNVPLSNLKAFQAIENSAMGTAGAAEGGWEPTQGYGSLDVQGLMNAYSSPNPRAATVGDATGIVYYGGTPIPNASVTATLVPSPHTVFRTNTLADGTYRFDAFPGGVYDISATPFGSKKTKRVLVSNGADFPGVDFFCGPAITDTTPPVIGMFSFVSSSPTTLVVKQWAYDTETEIDSAVGQIGSTPGASDLFAPTTIFAGQAAFTFGVKSLPDVYYAAITYTNGVGMTSVAERAINLVPSDAYVYTGASSDVVSNTLYLGTTGGHGPGSALPAVTYLNLDLSTVRANVVDATLTLQGSATGIGIKVGLYPTTGTFTEAGLTWANRPVLANSPSSDVNVAAQGTYSWNIASLVQAAVKAGKKSLTIALKSDSAGVGSATFASSSAPQLTAPHVTIDSHD